GTHACVLICNDPATAVMYTLSLHDALPISPDGAHAGDRDRGDGDHHPRSDPALAVDDAVGVDVWDRDLDQPRVGEVPAAGEHRQDRKSTRLNSSHVKISYAVFCLKKKNTTI